MRVKNGKIKILIGFIMAFVVAVVGVLFGAHFASLRLSENARADFLRVLNSQERDFNEDILVFNDNIAVAREVAKKTNGNLRESSDGGFASLTLPEGMDVYGFANDLSNAKYLSFVSLDYAVDIEEVQVEATYIRDNYYSEQTYFDYINMGNVWDTTKGKTSSGEKIVVAIIDSGIDVDNADFYDSRGRNHNISSLSYNATTNQVVSSAGLSVINDTHGHGTAVAGVIGAQINNKGIVGIAPDVELLVIKCEVNEKGQFISTSDIVYGIRYAVENGADVINMSFGGYSIITAQTQAINLAIENGIIPVASAGNEGVNNLHYPSSQDITIGVGALEDDSWLLADYSNYGKNTDIVAPGKTLTTYVDGQFVYITGTSFSAPIVSSACALYLAKHGKVDYQTLKNDLLISAKDIGKGGIDDSFGYGALDINSFVNGTRKTITYDYLDSGFANETYTYMSNNTMKTAPSYPEKGEFAVENWYFDKAYTKVLSYENRYTYKFTTETTLYAKWSRISDLFEQGKDEDFTVVNVTGGVEITAYNGNLRYLTIPSSINGKAVVSIGANAFASTERVRRVALPDTLKSIGAKAFGSINLPYIIIPSSVQSIGESAFGGASMSAVYIRSQSVLSAFGGGSENGMLTKNATAIAVEKGLQVPSLLLQKYIYTQEIEFEGVLYVVYSKHQHVWRKIDTLQEKVKCKADGKYLYGCDYCALKKHVIDEMHTESERKTELPTCEQNGMRYTECTACFEILKSEPILSEGHSLKHVEKKNPTCTEIGWAEYEYCENCSYTTYQEILENGHTESEWIIDVEVSCSQNGERHTECTVCFAPLQSETVFSQGHSIKQVEAKDPTCTEVGWHAYEYCENCSYTTYQEISENGHKIKTVEAKEPTCTEIGWAEYEYCENCSYTTYQEIGENGHSESEWIVDQILTCEQDGISHTECTVCFETLQTATEHTQGHDYQYSHTEQIDWQNQADGYDLYVCQNDNTHTQKRNIVAWQTLSVTVKVEGGTVNGESEVVVEKGSLVEIVATVDDGKKFVEWRINGESVGNEQTLMLVADENVTVIAKFKNTITITCKDSGKEVLGMVLSLSLIALALKKLFVK